LHFDVIGRCPVNRALPVPGYFFSAAKKSNQKTPPRTKKSDCICRTGPTLTRAMQPDFLRRPWTPQAHGNHSVSGFSHWLEITTVFEIFLLIV